MTVRPEVILSRLAHLARALIQLERLTRLPESERRDPLNVLALERALQLAAEAIFDIGPTSLRVAVTPFPRTIARYCPP